MKTYTVSALGALGALRYYVTTPARYYAGLRKSRRFIFAPTLNEYKMTPWWAHRFRTLEKARVVARFMSQGTDIVFRPRVVIQ